MPWTGHLVCDDFSGYKALFERGVVEVGCMAVDRQPDAYEPGAGGLLQEFCDHHSVAVLPARPAGQAQVAHACW